MRKKAILIVSILMILISCLIYYVTFLFNGLATHYINKENIIKVYNNNKSTFCELADFTLKDKKDVTIDKYKDKKFVVNEVGIGVNTIVYLKDKEIIKQINKLLFELNYKHIIEEGNSVYFLRQTGIGFEQGVVFSKDGNKPNGITIETLEHIENNWYYYEAK